MWVLILFVHAGAISHNDDVALQIVQGFTSEATCKLAGDKAKALDHGTVQDMNYTCVQVK